MRKNNLKNNNIAINKTMENNNVIEEDYIPQGSMTLREEVDMTVLRVIRDNFEEVYKRMGSECWLLDDKTKEYRQSDFKEAHTIINELYKTKSKSNQVKYRYVSHLKSGRRFASNSLQGISRRIRHTIAKDIYLDVDIRNAHPIFAKELCKRLNFTHRILDLYVENREACIKRWIGTEVTISTKTGNNWTSSRDTLKDKNDVKKYFLRVLYGGGNKNTSNTELNEHWETTHRLLEVVFKKIEFRRHRDRAIKKFKDRSEGEYENKKGSCMSYYLCEVENNVLIQIELYCQENNIEYGTLCFDGLMIYKDSVKNINDFIKSLEYRLLECFGFDINLAVKDMDEDIDISDLKVIDDVKTTDEDYALRILDVLKDDIKYDFYNGDIFFWSEKEGLWMEQKMRHLRTYITKILIPYIETSPDPDIVAEQSFIIKQDSKQSAIVRMCEPYIEQRRDDAFISTHFNRKKGFFPIADKKVINLRTGEVRNRIREDFFTKTTERHIYQLTPDRREFILNYFSEILTKENQDKASNKHRDCLLYFIAYIFTNENHLKLFGNLIGNKDAGKSLFLELLCEMLGEFGGWANARLFVEQKNTSCHDSELFNLRGKRMSCLSETSSKQKYNEDLIKKISGGDKVNIRGAGEKKTVDELFACVLVLATNNVCEFSDPAFMSRLMCFNFCNSFKRDASVKEKMLVKIDDFFTIICEYAKTFYDNDRQIEWSDEVLAYTNHICEEQDTIKVWCRDQVTFTKYNSANSDHNVKDFFIEKTGLFERYKEYWSDSGRKYESKIIFYRSFEKLFGLNPAKKVRRGLETVWCYEYIKECE